MLMCNLSGALRHARIGRRYLLTTIGGDLVALFHSSGAIVVREPRHDDRPSGGYSNELRAYTRLHYGGKGWGAEWASTLPGELFVHASGAFTVKKLHEQCAERYWQEQVPPDPAAAEAALSALIEDLE